MLRASRLTVRSVRCGAQIRTWAESEVRGTMRASHWLERRGSKVVCFVWHREAVHRGQSEYEGDEEETRARNQAIISRYRTCSWPDLIWTEYSSMRIKTRHLGGRNNAMEARSTS